MVEDELGSITGNGTAVHGLGGSAGFGETALARGDDTVTQVNVAAVFEKGFTLGGVHYDADDLFVSTDGLISFGAGVTGVAADASAIAAPFFAIFNGDVDTRLDGEGAESGGVWLDVDTVQDCVTITWDHVGFYRRNATTTDTFQIQLFDRGNGGFEVVYRYQDISWTSGDLQGGFGGRDGIAALIGHRTTATGAATLLAASGNQTAELALEGALGNTGVAGLWVWSFLAPSLIVGTAGADTLTGTTRNDTLRGLGGSDVLTASDGADLMDGGDGTDRAFYAFAPGAIRIDLVTPSANLGFAQGDTFAFVEEFAGSAFDDTILGASSNDKLIGNGGEDVMQGRGGNDSFFGCDAADQIWGQEGDDFLDGGTGNDSLHGNWGRDRIAGQTGDDVVLGGCADDTIFGGDGADHLYGGTQADVLWGGGDPAGFGDWLSGGGGNDQLNGWDRDDTLFGDSGSDTLWGNDGNDLMLGHSGDDFLYGGGGSDTLRGGPGGDTLSGGYGADTLTGGLGADQFWHAGVIGSGSDLVMDFDNAEGDRLVFGIAGAMRSDFSVTVSTVVGAGRPGVAEVSVTYLPTHKLIFVVVDGAAQDAILLQSSANSFDLL